MLYLHWWFPLATHSYMPQLCSMISSDHLADAASAPSEPEILCADSEEGLPWFPIFKDALLNHSRPHRSSWSSHFPSKAKFVFWWFLFQNAKQPNNLFKLPSELSLTGLSLFTLHSTFSSFKFPQNSPPGSQYSMAFPDQHSRATINLLKTCSGLSQPFPLLALIFILGSLCCYDKIPWPKTTWEQMGFPSYTS